MTGRRRKAIGLNLLWLVPGVVGGSEEYTTRLIGALADLAPDDLEFTMYVNTRFVREYPELCARFRTVVGPVSGTSKARRVLVENTWLAWASRRQGIELMHHLGGIVPLWRPAPTVLTMHDLQPLALPGHFSGPKRAFSAAVIPRSVRVARHIVTLTEFTRHDLAERLDVDPARVVVVAPGFDLPPATIPAGVEAGVRRRYRLGDQPYFLFPAKTWPHKNHQMLLRAFARLHERRPDVLLVLTGGEDQNESVVRDLIVELHLQGAVRRTGRISVEDLDALYRAATALTFPSLYEGFGLPVLEAMSRGCPVIAADATALPEVVNGAGLLVPPDNPEEWSKAMQLVLEDDAVRAQLIVAGHEHAVRHDWHEAAETLASVYRRGPV